MPTISIDTPIGPLTLVASEDALVEVRWKRQPPDHPTPLLEEAARQLKAYFAHQLRRFELPLAPAGPEAERSVWHAMETIPYGETRSYGELAQVTGLEARDVGVACGRNPLPIFIPCHRVLGAGGTLTGYSGGRGVETKRQLLVLEGALLI